MAHSSDMTSLTDYRNRLRQHLDKLRETGRPLFVTTNGKTDAVVLSPEAYDALVERVEQAEVLEQIARSEADIAAGRTVEVRELFQLLASKHGLTLDDSVPGGGVD